VAIAYLHAMVTVGKVLHGLELLVDDADAGLMGAVNNALDVLGRLAHLPELHIDALSRLNSSLRVELRCKTSSQPKIFNAPVERKDLPGHETLNSTFSIT